MTIERHIYSNWSELSTYLTSKGFTIANNKMYWTASTELNCHWTITTTANEETINFVNSNNESVFDTDLVDFSNGGYAGVIFVPLIDNGCILYLTTLEEYNLTDLVLQAFGSIIVTPANADTDNKWYYTWMNIDSDVSCWYTDNGISCVADNICPHKKVIPGDTCTTIVKAFLDTGYWSKYIFNIIIGELTPPNMVFRLNGQRYLCLVTEDNDVFYRSPCFRLIANPETPNSTTSTEAYSPYKTYAVGDYCIYNGYLWKCIIAVSAAEPFDEDKWEITTVDTEINRYI